ncbi:MAG: VOC family protein [Verrucomicrobiota bacterium]|nr:VOC family protein [Verrucomicrobiota bacterium]
MSSIKPVPEDYPVITAAIAAKNASEAIEFYKKAFGAIERMRLEDKQGKIGHAELNIAGGLIMISDVFPEYNHIPEEFGGTTVVLHIYVADVDSFVSRAAAAGAKLIMPPADQFYGDRSARIEDPYGHVWAIATRKENVPIEEIKRRFAAM